MDKVEEKLSVEQGNKIIAEDYGIFNDGTIIGKKGKALKLHKGTSGYYQLNIRKGKKQKTYLVHRLVAEMYLPNPDDLPEVNHKDGNKENNRVGNLQWCTRPQNIQHGFDTGLITPPWKGKSGSKHIRSKAIYQCDSCGNAFKEYGSIREAGRVTGIHNIDDALSGRNKSAGGYIWKYKN